MRCWQGKTDGWASSTFHSKCDGKGPTVTIVQVGSYIFGGYTDKSWSSPSPGRYQLHIWWLDLENWLLCLDSFCPTGLLGMHTQVILQPADFLHYTVFVTEGSHINIFSLLN